jgi:hypothetical protein
MWRQIDTCRLKLVDAVGRLIRYVVEFGGCECTTCQCVAEEVAQHVP